MKHIALSLALLASPVLLTAAPAIAQGTSGVHAAAETTQDKADLSRIESYLNGLKNLSAQFIQIDDAGGIQHGHIDISRPGKMKVTYNPPNQDFIIADGEFVHIWNADLKSQTNVEQGSSLAEFILRDPVRLNGDVTVTAIAHKPAKIEITLVQTKDPAAGSLTLIFEDQPLALRQWKVVDAQGHSTNVSLQDVQQGVTFPDGTFTFVAPNFGK